MFQGRIGVGRYWHAIIILVLLNLLATIILGAAAFFGFAALVESSSPENGLGMLLLGAMIAPFIAVIPSLVMLPFALGLQVRRFHDYGITGWAVPGLMVLGIVLGALFPIYDPAMLATGGGFPPISPVGGAVSALLFILGLVLVCIPGSKGTNTYGPKVRYRSVWLAILGKNPEPAE
jgi:uncharacterized membrane protein YhaH (DUF805 family)